MASSLLAQSSLEEQYKYALNLYQRGEYYDCITELKRLIFFDVSRSYSYEANYLIGSCYKRGAKIDDAIQHFSVSLMFTKNPGEIYNSKIEIIKCNILRRTTPAALQILHDMEKDERFKDKSSELIYWEGWVYIFEDNWGKAAETFARIDENHPLKKLSAETAEKKYSMSFAKVISYILPGSGQIYTGHILPGFLSLGWNGILIYFSVHSFYAERIFDGFITTGFFFRFYKGNIENTEKFVKQENLKISNETLKYLQFEYKGPKP
jgi:tetratricopeptide (TPR) repeat protein